VNELLVVIFSIPIAILYEHLSACESGLLSFFQLY